MMTHVEHNAPPSPRLLQRAGEVVLVLAVALLLAVMFVLYYFGGVHGAVGLDTSSGPHHLWVEWAIFPLVVIASTVVGSSHPHFVAAFRARQNLYSAWLAVVLLVVFCAFTVLMANWYESCGEHTCGGGIGLVRGLGAALAAAVVFAEALLYPRQTGVLAGALGAPAWFAILVLAFPGPLYYRIGDNYVSGQEFAVLLGGAGAITLSVLLMSLGLGWRRRALQGSMAYTIYSSAIMLPVVVAGYLFVLSSDG